MASTRIHVTKNYRMFKYGDSPDNRQLNLNLHRALRKSMQKYGFIRSYPAVCFRDGKGDLIVRDGQHRIAIAQELDLPVHYVEEATDFDVAIINSTPKNWTVKDFAVRFSSQGKESYQWALEFAENWKVPLSLSFALLAGYSSFTNVKIAVQSGEFQIKDLKWAESVAQLYKPLVEVSPKSKTPRLLEACMAVCQVKEFEAKRLIGGAQRCPEQLKPFGTRDAYLTAFEELYNFGRKQLFGLKVAAMMAMKSRSGAEIQKRKKAEREEQEQKDRQSA